MDKNQVKEVIQKYLQSEYSEEKFGGAPQEEIVDSIYSIIEEKLEQTELSDENISDIIDEAVIGVQQLYNCSDDTLALFEAMNSAETELGIEFTEDDINYLQDTFTQTQFSEGTEIKQEAYNLIYDYLEQNLYSFFPSHRETKNMLKDVRKAGEAYGILRERTLSEKLKSRFGPRRSAVKTAWDTAKLITTSPIGEVAVASQVQNLQMKGLNKIQEAVAKRNAVAGQRTYSEAAEIINDLFSESEEVTAQRNADALERANSETAGETLIPLETAPLHNDSQESDAAISHEVNPIADADDHNQKEASIDFIKETEKSIDLHDDASKAPTENFADETFDSIQNLYSILWRPSSKNYEDRATRWTKNPITNKYEDLGPSRVYTSNAVGPVSLQETLPLGGKGSRYFGKDDGSIGVGTLGTGSEYRQWRAQLDRNSRGAIAFDPKMLTAAMTDAIVEGMLAGTYYQSLDTGLQLSSGTIKRGYKGLSALIKPTLDKAQERLERSGNKMANWALPDGPSASDIIDMDGKDAKEVIKVLDQTNYLNKLPEQARTLFLINLSKSGICYIDEKGTLTKRTIVEKLINTYKVNPDEFFEILPLELQNIKDLYSKNALVNKDSINVDIIYNKLKDAKSVEQVQSILTDELNVLKKPLTSLDDLVNAIANDFIMLKKSDSRQFKYVINKIARDVEVLARKNGEDSLSSISRAFLRNLSASVNEVDIKRTVEKLVIANIKYLNDLLDVKSSNFAEQEIDVEGGNVNMENSPVKSTGTRTNVAPSNLGQTAGWTPEEQDKGDMNPTTAPLEDAKDEATQQKFSIDEHFTQPSSHQGQASEMVSAPGFGVGAYMNL